MLQPEVLGLDLELPEFDLSLTNRRATSNEVVLEAAEAMRDAGFGVKAATITPEGAGRRGLPQPHPAGGDRRHGDRAHRAQDPGVTPIAGVHYPISVVRMAVGDAYGAVQWREGDPETTTRSRCAPSGSRGQCAAG